MSVALALWSHAIVPGKSESLIPGQDIRITNASLGEVIQDESGRSTLKLTFEKVSTGDSDDEGEEKGEKGDDDISSLSTTFVCSLSAGKIEQTVLDITLLEDNEYIFDVVGKNTIYLTGNYIHQNDNEPPYGDMGMSDMDSDDEDDAYDLRDVSSDVEMHPDELDGMDSDASRFEEVAEEATAAKSKKRARDSDATEGKPTSKAEKKNKKQKTESAQQDKTETPEKPGKGEAKEKKEKKGQGDKQQEAAVRELPNGVKIKDAKTGSGAGAKNGQTVEMRYIGKLANGKQFDSNTKGKPFKFRLGAGEVIKGWDTGLVGIKVGGERVLTIPPASGYGKRGSPPEIPPNSTLVFEVKCLSIK
ncbi:peptidylprolyl isomerase fpr3 [Marasmius tenuissimus]|uniref:FK506-binding protein n=1 Tax=Marasmius tenuissimus TaxID=585030 RepID=A0ABR3A4R1_9AGAR|nr:peptidylprolyl isomerase fpr3 [Marasmius tenuissimus]